MNWLESLKSPDVGPWVFVLLLFLIVVVFNVFRHFKNKRLRNQKEEQKKTENTTESKPEEKKDKPKSKKPWKFPSLFGWVSFGWMKNLTWDKFITRIIIPILIIIGALLQYFEKISLSNSEIFWLVIISVIVVVFSSRSDTFRWIVIWSFVVLIIIYCILVVLSFFQSLKEVPDKIPYLKVKFEVDYDVHNPRWTEAYIDVPDSSWLEISAEGSHRLTLNRKWDVCGPEGETYINPKGKRVGVVPSTEGMEFPEQFLLPDERRAIFMVKIGENGKVSSIGKYKKIFVETGGRLYLATNKRWHNPGNGKYKLNWKKSSGLFKVSIAIYPLD